MNRSACVFDKSNVVREAPAGHLHLLTKGLLPFVGRRPGAGNETVQSIVHNRILFILIYDEMQLTAPPPLTRRSKVLAKVKKGCIGT